LKPVGLIQVGFFTKTCEIPSFLKRFLHTVSWFTETEAGYGTKATSLASRRQYQQLLTFLPGLLNGLGASPTTAVRLPKPWCPTEPTIPHWRGKEPNNWNIGVTYDKKRLSTRFASRNNDAHLPV